MSMLDGFFKKGFNGAKCKTLLKLTIPRIKLLRNRREIQLKQMRRDIAKLLEGGQEATARIRVEHIIREENMMAAQEIIELFCELINARLPIIETQRECPLDLKEAISSICFAAPRCSDLIELQQVQMLFAAKYGREFVTAAAELMPECGVNRQIIELLSVRAPSVEAKLKLLKEIAEEHELDWDPAASETEFLKPHEDLLNGPNHVIIEPPLPYSKEKHDSSSNPAKESDEGHDTEAFDSLDLPAVPRVSVRASSDIPSALDSIPPQTGSSKHHLQPGHEFFKLASSEKDVIIHHVNHEVDNLGPSLAASDTPPSFSVATGENKQFIPFVSPPSSPCVSIPLKQSEPDPYLPPNQNEIDVGSPSQPSSSFPARKKEPVPYFSRTKSDINVDFQDVLAAAHAAAETAERAATAARSAASLAQVRINELVTKRNYKISGENEVPVELSDKLDIPKKLKFDQQNALGRIAPNCDPICSNLDSPTLSSHNVPNILEAESPDPMKQAAVHQPARQTLRSTSLEDDPYFSYPNLFTLQDTNLKSVNQSPPENSRSAHEF